MDQTKPNKITRALIDSTVERGLKEIEEDPKRSIRKLTDMGRLFNRGRFMDEIFDMVQDLLRNDDSPYYETIERLLRSTNRDHLKNFCISFGYSGLTFGGSVLREKEKALQERLPWALSLRVNPALPGSLSLAEVKSCVAQGQGLGIYVYFIVLKKCLSALPALLALFQENPDCAFLCLLPDEPLTEPLLTAIAACHNTLCLLPAFTAHTAASVDMLRRRKVLYSIYASYSDEDAAAWLSGSRVADLLPYGASVNLLVSDDACSRRCQARVAKYCRSERVHPTMPLILFDMMGDMCQISHIISEQPDGLYLELLENGDLRTDRGIVSDFRHTISLERLLDVRRRAQP